MNKDRAEGNLNDIKGRIKRQAGEWSGDQELQAEGTQDQLKGKAQNVMGRAKDAAHDVKRDFSDDDDDDEKGAA